MRSYQRAVGAGLTFLIVACSDATAPTAPSAASSRPAAPGAALADRRAIQIDIATGLYDTSVPAEVFGVVVDASLAFEAEMHNGAASGKFAYSERDGGAGAPTYRYSGSVTCLQVYDFDGLSGNRAKIGGVVEHSTDPTIPAGTFMWWQSIDEGPRASGKTTLAGFGDAAANLAFCNSNAPPRFGPFAVHGPIVVKAI